MDRHEHSEEKTDTNTLNSTAWQLPGKYWDRFFYSAWTDSDFSDILNHTGTAIFNSVEPNWDKSEPDMYFM